MPRFCHSMQSHWLFLFLCFWSLIYFSFDRRKENFLSTGSLSKCPQQLELCQTKARRSQECLQVFYMCYTCQVMWPIRAASHVHWQRAGLKEEVELSPRHFNKGNWHLNWTLVSHHDICSFKMLEAWNIWKKQESILRKKKTHGIWCIMESSRFSANRISMLTLSPHVFSEVISLRKNNNRLKLSFVDAFKALLLPHNSRYVLGLPILK